MAKDFIFISGNQGKIDHLRLWLEMPVEHRKLDLDELQSLDIRVIAEHKARQAYAMLQQRPVLIEDVGLTFTAMGKLPGTLVKWFLEEIGNDGLCKIADGLPHRQAIASICYAYFDGDELQFFENHVQGVVAATPRGDVGFGWNPIFQPDGSDKTYGEMTEDEVRPFSVRAQAIDKLRDFLQSA